MKRTAAFLCLIIGLMIISYPSIAEPPNIAWFQTYDVVELDEWGNCVIQTPDSGFVITGSINYGLEGKNVLLMKTDGIGEVLWHHSYGDTSQLDYGLSVQQTLDQGFIITGSTISIDNGSIDVLLMKTDSEGNVEWSQVFGETGSDNGHAVQQTADGGYLIVGDTGAAGEWNSDLWLIKTDANGNEEWNQTYGGESNEGGHDIQPTSDGGYIVTGHSSSTVSGSTDAILMKLNSTGEVQWSRLLGNFQRDEIGESVIQTSEGGYIIVGFSSTHTETMVLLIKTDANGDQLWYREFLSYGDVYQENDDVANGVVQTPNGAYVITGYTNSVQDENPHPRTWLMKIDPLGNQIWHDKFTELPWETDANGKGIVQTFDGGYAVAGYTKHSEGWYEVKDILLFKTESDSRPFLVSIVPNDDWIRIPGEGGSFRFNAFIFNSLDTPYAGQIWTAVTTPNGQTITGGPLPLVDVLFQPGIPVYQRSILQNVPGFAPQGDYTYMVRVGMYPDVIQGQHSFDFYKSSPASPSYSSGDWSTTGWVGEEVSTTSLIPDQYVVESIYPNPFNPTTTISISLPAASDLTVRVFNTLGQEVAILADGQHSAGTHSFTFDASGLSSGIYFVQVSVPGVLNEMKKVVLLK
jgi:Secretion system C-terminal sorting domain